MRAHRYSRWDGSQSEFSLDADEALDALSELMMEGLDAREALEWMRQQGFELGGMNMRVMGIEELTWSTSTDDRLPSAASVSTAVARPSAWRTVVA